MRPERSFHYLVLSISAAFLFVLASFSAASAATITVTNTDDSGVGSLRAAITDAHPGDTIAFSVTGTINLTSGLLTISKNLTIKGPDADKLTINGNGDTVFDITSGTVHISGLTISGAATSGPGGIRNVGTLTVTNCTFSDNSAGYGGGIYNHNGGTLKVMNSTFSDNSASLGGGIANDGTLTVTDSTFSGNSATSGGGIDNFIGTLKVMNSTFSGNKARVGGGIDNENTLTATNCTFSGNTADSFGGGIWNTDTSTVTNSTLSGNSATSGGGIYDPTGSVSLRNTVAANNTGGNCAGPGTITSLGHNLEYPGTSCNFTATGDIVGQDPQLDPLALNAPGTTETMALQSGSPAIDAGDNSDLPPTDQRGAVRIWDGDGNSTAIVDIGAYEYGAPLYVPPGVPTMNEWGMIIFVLLAGLGSVYYLRRRAES
jgi:predicted outer membrane repeat protein